MAKILISDPIHENALSQLMQSSHEIFDHSENKDGFENILPIVDGIIIRSATKLTTDILAKCGNLKFIARSGVGLDNVDLEKCKELGIKVVNSPEGPTRSVAELTLGLMIAASRKFGITIQGTKEGNWPKKQKGTELYNKTIGIIGTGAIGAMFANYCLALGMKVIGYDIIKNQSLVSLDNFEYSSLENLISNSDIISLHVPLLPQTKHMINKDTIDQMKDGVILLNASRGGLFDENALLDGLNSGKIAGIGLDVYETEPVSSNNILVNHPLSVTTPHIGAQTSEASRNNSMIVTQKLLEFFNKFDK